MKINFLKKYIAAGLLLLLSGCASFILKDPVGKNSGGVAITIYVTFGKGTLFETSYPAYTAKLMEKQSDGSYKALPPNQVRFFQPEVGSYGQWGPHHVFVNLDPNKTYALSYVYTEYTVSGNYSSTTYQFPLNFNPKETENIITFKPEAGKIKYYGVYMVEKVVLQQANIFKGQAEDSEFRIKPGLEHLQKRFLDKMNGMVFGLNKHDIKGAEKRLLSALAVEGGKSRWTEIMKARLKEL